ncbi:MAG: hypothetical protein WCO99_00895, partial [Planctomycetota bacterium]
MNTRTFGRTGWRVSEIGFGGWGIGGQRPKQALQLGRGAELIEADRHRGLGAAPCHAAAQVETGGSRAGQQVRGPGRP